MNRIKFAPTVGCIYRNHGGGAFECIATDGNAFMMRNVASGWALCAHGIEMYDDGSIEWDYSTMGHFEEKKGGNKADPSPDILENAVNTWGKAAQVDMMIEEMSELTKALLKERRGQYVPEEQKEVRVMEQRAREDNIAEEMADVRIMLRQMEIIFKNSEKVKEWEQEKIRRIFYRLKAAGKEGRK